MVLEKSSSLRRRLDRLAVRCPDCRQVWLAPGLATGDEYACKECGGMFVKKGAVGSERSRDLLSPHLPPSVAVSETPA